MEKNTKSFLDTTVEFLLDRKFTKEQAEDETKIVNLIVKYFESVNTVKGAFENYENGSEAWEGDYVLARKEYYPEFIKKWRELN